MNYTDLLECRGFFSWEDMMLNFEGHSLKLRKDIGEKSLLVANLSRSPFLVRGAEVMPHLVSKSVWRVEFFY